MIFSSRLATGAGVFVVVGRSFSLYFRASVRRTLTRTVVWIFVRRHSCVNHLASSASFATSLARASAGPCEKETRRVGVVCCRRRFSRRLLRGLPGQARPRLNGRCTDRATNEHAAVLRFARPEHQRNLHGARCGLPGCSECYKALPIFFFSFFPRSLQVAAAPRQAARSARPAVAVA